MRLQGFLSEAELTDDEKKAKDKAEKTRKQSKNTLKGGLRKLDDHMDAFTDEIEREIEKIEDNPSFQYKIGLMLSNLEKEQGEYLIALRQVVQTIGKSAGIIPQVRGHAKGMVPDAKPKQADDIEDVRDVVDGEIEKEDEKEKA